ncbi:MAG TPA: hypothetical protein VK971_02135 [Thiohalobacter sp.]|nr:hypothetical protein [Thiohalobacter sp.]
MSDLTNNIKVTPVIVPQSPSATGTMSGSVIDTQDAISTTFIISAGAQTTTGVTVTPVVKSGTATGSTASAEASELIGTEAAAALDGTDGASSSSKIGYIGTNRYVTVDLAVANAATGVYSVQCVQEMRKGPQS